MDQTYQEYVPVPPTLSSPYQNPDFAYMNRVQKAIQASRPAFEDVENITQIIENKTRLLKNKKKAMSPLALVIALVAGGFYFWYELSARRSELGNSTDALMRLFSIFSFPIIVFLIASIIIKKIRGANLDKKFAEERAKLENDRNTAFQFILDQRQGNPDLASFPADYYHPYSIDTLATYFANRRVNTFSEAVNLLELERHQQRLEQSAQDAMMYSRAALESAEAARRSANVAAAASVVSAFRR